MRYLRRTPKTLLEFLSDKPPFLIFFLARQGRTGGTRAIPWCDKLIRSGLSHRKLGKMSRSWEWSNFTIAEIDAFCRGCGVDLFHFKDEYAYIKWTKGPTKRGFFRHLNTVQREKLVALCRRWLIYQEQKKGNG